MKCSPARLAANRANSLKSRGPADTSRTRFNALKHGMTAASIALPGEDRQFIERRHDGLFRQFDPQTEREVILVDRAFYLSIRLLRCQQYDIAAQSFLVRHAVEVFHDQRIDELNLAIGRLDAEPEAVVETLRRDPDGLDWLVEQWETLRRSLIESEPFESGVTGGGGPFGISEARLMVNLMGREFGFDAKPREAKLHEAFGGYFGNLDPRDREAVPDQAKPEWARGQLLAIIDRELSGVKGIREAFDLANLRADQEEAVDRALFDPSKEAILARRYEAATERSLKKTFRELDELAILKAEAIEEVTPTAPEVPNDPEVASKGRGSLASFCKIKEATFEVGENRPISVPEGPPGAEMMSLTGRPGVEKDVIPPKIE